MVLDVGSDYDGNQTQQHSYTLQMTCVWYIYLCELCVIPFRQHYFCLGSAIQNKVIKKIQDHDFNCLYRCETVHRGKKRACVSEQDSKEDARIMRIQGLGKERRLVKIL